MIKILINLKFKINNQVVLCIYMVIKIKNNKKNNKTQNMFKQILMKWMKNLINVIIISKQFQIKNQKHLKIKVMAKFIQFNLRIKTN